MRRRSKTVSHLFWSLKGHLSGICKWITGSEVGRLSSNISTSNIKGQHSSIQEILHNVTEKFKEILKNDYLQNNLIDGGGAVPQDGVLGFVEYVDV